jgi:hypothetical protein
MFVEINSKEDGCEVGRAILFEVAWGAGFARKAEPLLLWVVGCPFV